MFSQAYICRTFVLPKLYAVGWTDDQLTEQRAFPDGRNIVHGQRARCRPGKRVDYLLRYTRGLAVVEPKPRILHISDSAFLVDNPKDKIFSPFGEAVTNPKRSTFLHLSLQTSKKNNYEEVNSKVNRKKAYFSVPEAT